MTILDKNTQAAPPTLPEQLTRPGALPFCMSRKQTALVSAFAPRVYWKISMLAERWDVHTRTVNRMIERGDLQAIRIAGRHRVPDLERLRIEALADAA